MIKKYYSGDTNEREIFVYLINMLTSKNAVEDGCKLSYCDRVFLPYVVGKYGIDITNDMLISVLEAGNRKVLYYCFKDLIADMAANNRKFIIGLSSIIGNERAENFLDIDRSAKQLSKDEVLFVPMMNTGFLSIRQEDAYFRSNLMCCINKVCKDLELKISSTLENNKIVSHLSGTESAIVLTFSK